MRRIGFIFLAGFGVAVLCSGLWGTAAAQEKVTLRLAYPEGQTARYKQSYSFEYFSDRAELILLAGAQTGSVRVTIDGEWKSAEKARPPVPRPGETVEAGAIEVLATIENADSRVNFNRETLTYEQFPFKLDMLNGRNFTWLFWPNGRADRLLPEFRAYEIPRQDIITDLGHVWMPEFSPAMPEGPVGVGESWTAEKTFEMPYSNVAPTTQKALLKTTSTYKLDKVEVKKGQTRATVREDRKFTYGGWMHIEFVSLFLNGEGRGTGEWVLDLDNGLIVSHQIRMDIDHPQVMVANQKKPLSDIRAEVKLLFKRELEKIDK